MTVYGFDDQLVIKGVKKELPRLTSRRLSSIFDLFLVRFHIQTLHNIQPFWFTFKKSFEYFWCMDIYSEPCFILILAHLFTILWQYNIFINFYLQDLNECFFFGFLRKVQLCLLRMIFYDAVYYIFANIVFYLIHKVINSKLVFTIINY